MGWGSLDYYKLNGKSLNMVGMHCNLCFKRILGLLCENALERGKREGEPSGSVCNLVGERWLVQWYGRDGEQSGPLVFWKKNNQDVGCLR